MTLKINDTVILLDEPKRSPNRKARIDAITKTHVQVSNLNMPFCGTYAGVLVPIDRVEAVKTQYQ